MSTPVLHLLAGPNGSGKTTFFEEVLAPVTHLRFLNADALAAARWPGAEPEHAYDASRLAAEQRDALLARRASFATETVFSHPSKVELVERARAGGYVVTLHVLLVPEELAVARVVSRVANGGHHVPEVKVRERYHRLWPLVRRALPSAQQAIVYDSSRAGRFQRVAELHDGTLIGSAAWPAWAPADLTRPIRRRRSS